MQQYVTLKKECFTPEDLSTIKDFCEQFELDGTEVFMDDVCNRTNVLFSNESEKQILVKKLSSSFVKRLHCSYWAYPTSFLSKNNFTQLVQRFGSIEAIKEYYGDLTGKKMFERWALEYELAAALHAQSFTFHLIDYAPIDGMWEFTISKEDILQAMVGMLQHFINLLFDKGLMTPDSPQIEIENAGWGLEYGIQTGEEYAMLYKQLFDPLSKVKIGWDINHLLHAIGYDIKKGIARFFLTEKEITPVMKDLQTQYGNQPDVFAKKWIELNVMHPDVVEKVGAIQLSDCALKKTQYFTNGILSGKYYDDISSLKTWEEREDYGVKIVLSEYDSHVVLGDGIFKPQFAKEFLTQLQQKNKNVVILHELKNSKNMRADLSKQINLLK